MINTSQLLQPKPRAKPANSPFKSFVLPPSPVSAIFQEAGGTDSKEKTWKDLQKPRMQRNLRYKQGNLKTGGLRGLSKISLPEAKVSRQVGYHSSLARPQKRTETPTCESQSNSALQAPTDFLTQTAHKEMFPRKHQPVVFSNEAAQVIEEALEQQGNPTALNLFRQAFNGPSQFPERRLNGCIPCMKSTTETRSTDPDNQDATNFQSRPSENPHVVRDAQVQASICSDCSNGGHPLEDIEDSLSSCRGLQGQGKQESQTHFFQTFSRPTTRGEQAVFPLDINISSLGSSIEEMQLETSCGFSKQGKDSNSNLRLPSNAGRQPYYTEATQMTQEDERTFNFSQLESDRKKRRTLRMREVSNRFATDTKVASPTVSRLQALHVSVKNHQLRQRSKNLMSQLDYLMTTQNNSNVLQIPSSAIDFLRAPFSPKEDGAKLKGTATSKREADRGTLAHAMADRNPFKGPLRIEERAQSQLFVPPSPQRQQSSEKSVPLEVVQFQMTGLTSPPNRAPGLPVNRTACLSPGLLPKGQRLRPSINPPGQKKQLLQKVDTNSPNFLPNPKVFRAYPNITRMLSPLRSPPRQQSSKLESLMKRPSALKTAHKPGVEGQKVLLITKH